MTKKSPKISSKWNIAATHYLTAGFAMPIIINLLVGIIFDNPGNIIVIGSWLLGIIAGVIYSARYVRKTYIIKDVVAISRITVLYNVVIYSLLIFNSAVKPFSSGVSELVSDYYAFVAASTWIILAVISSLVLYFVSNRFLR